MKHVISALILFAGVGQVGGGGAFADDHQSSHDRDNRNLQLVCESEGEDSCGLRLWMKKRECNEGSCQRCKVDVQDVWRQCEMADPHSIEISEGDTITHYFHGDKMGVVVREESGKTPDMYDNIVAVRGKWGRYGRVVTVEVEKDGDVVVAETKRKGVHLASTLARSVYFPCSLKDIAPRPTGNAHCD